MNIERFIEPFRTAPHRSQQRAAMVAAATQFVAETEAELWTREHVQRYLRIEARKRDCAELDDIAKSGYNRPEEFFQRFHIQAAVDQSPNHNLPCWVSITPKHKVAVFAEKEEATRATRAKFVFCIQSDYTIRWPRVTRSLTSSRTGPHERHDFTNLSNKSKSTLCLFAPYVLFPVDLMSSSETDSGVDGSWCVDRQSHRWQRVKIVQILVVFDHVLFGRKVFFPVDFVSSSETDSRVDGSWCVNGPRHGWQLVEIVHLVVFGHVFFRQSYTGNEKAKRVYDHVTRQGGPHVQRG